MVVFIVLFHNILRLYLRGRFFVLLIWFCYFNTYTYIGYPFETDALYLINLAHGVFNFDGITSGFKELNIFFIPKLVVFYILSFTQPTTVGSGHFIFQSVGNYFPVGKMYICYQKKITKRVFVGVS